MLGIGSDSMGALRVPQGQTSKGPEACASGPSNHYAIVSLDQYPALLRSRRPGPGRHLDHIGHHARTHGLRSLLALPSLDRALPVDLPNSEQDPGIRDVVLHTACVSYQSEVLF